MNTMKKTYVRCTALQLKHLCEYMVANPDLLNGALTPDMVARKQAKFNKLRKILRSYGPDKSIQQWKHTWRDVVRKNRHRQENECVFVDRQYELIQKALENAKNFDFNDEERWADNKLWISLDERPKKLLVNVVKHEVEDPLYEGVEYLEQDQYLDQDLNNESQHNERQENETVRPTSSVPDTTKNLHIVLEPLKVISASERDLYPQIASPGSSNSTLPSPAPPPRKKQKLTPNNHVDEQVREAYDSGQCDRDIDVLNTLNKFIEYEKEKDKLQHEREMTRIKQADKLLNVMDKIANVFTDLAPSIKNFLDRQDS